MDPPLRTWRDFDYAISPIPLRDGQIEDDFDGFPQNLVVGILAGPPRFGRITRLPQAELPIDSDIEHERGAL